jgi:nuclear pore complex protein Nup160
MADTVPSYLYKETRLNLESSIPSSTVLLRLPSPGTSTWSSKTAQKRPLPTDVPVAEDENAFKLRNLASAASIYNRQHHQSPRSFLWRVLEDSKVLAIRAFDLCKQDKTSDHHLTLRLTFPSAIRMNCIALADTKEHDVLSVYVLTESNYLYTLTLRPEFFRRRSATDDNVADWCKAYLPRALGPSHAHRLVSLGADSLLVSLHDGGLLKLDQRSGERGSAWDEMHYNEGGWNSLRSLIPFQGNNTMKYGKINLELAAVTSIAAPATMIHDTPYVFTVSLDHRLRVWNLESRKIAYNGDLLNIEHAPTEMGKYVIHPSLSQLVKVYQDVNEKVLVVTYSPAGAGQFKFWSVNAEMDGNLELMDQFPDEVLEPPAPTTDVWTLADFSVDFNKSNSSRVSLWVLWKNNLTYRVQKVDFQLDSGSARAAWANDWVAVATETLAETPLPLNLPSDPADPTQKWVEHILYPGRFTAATIETSLSLYERGMGGAKNSTLRTSKNLAEKMCSLIASTTTVGRSSEGMDYDQFRTAVDAQWRRFYRLVSELDKQRGEALSFAFDPSSQLAWVVTSDGVSAIRDCSPIERLWHNPDSILPQQVEAVAALVTAASVFRDSFSDALLHACKTILTAELSQDPSSADPARLRAFYDNCNFGGQITDDDYTQLLSNLGGNFKGVKHEVYESLLGAMTASEESDQRLERLQLAEVGKKTVIKGVQETIEMHQAILFDQIVLLVFIESELDPEEDDIQLDTAVIYKQLLIMLRRLELLSWLAKTQISIPLPKTERSNSITEKTTSPSKRSDLTQTVTVLEACTSHLLGLTAHTDEPVSSLLTDMLIRVCDPEAEYELQPVMIQAFLLKLDRPDLAGEFSKFCDKDPFSVYIQGRVALAVKDLETAAMCFKKAAFGLGKSIFVKYIYIYIYASANFQ